MSSQTPRTRNAAQSSMTASAVMPIVQRTRRFCSASVVTLLAPASQEVARECFEVVVDARELRRRGEKYDTEEPVERIGAEAGAVDAEHARFAEQPEDEIFVRLTWRKHNP